MPGTTGSAPTIFTGNGSCSAPSASVGNHSKRSANCGSSATVLGVWHGAIGTSTSMPNCTHSAVDFDPKIGVSSACSSRLPRAWSPYSEPGHRSNSSGRPTASQNFFQKCCSLAMNSTCPSVDAYTWYRTPPTIPAIAGSRRT